MKYERKKKLCPVEGIVKTLEMPLSLQLLCFARQLLILYPVLVYCRCLLVLQISEPTDSSKVLCHLLVRPLFLATLPRHRHEMSLFFLMPCLNADFLETF
jgi:hypothetical protein